VSTLASEGTEIHNLTLVAGKSLEQIDEIFGDIQKKHDLECHGEGDAMAEKNGAEIVEAAR
jgi:hypothetical protein